MIEFIAGFFVGCTALVVLAVFFTFGEDLDDSDEGYL